MKKFEYRIVSLIKDSLINFDITEFLNSGGKEGWELIHVSDSIYFKEFIFKREKVEP